MLGCKNDLLLSYLHHLTLIVLTKLSGQSIADTALVTELVRLRVVMEKIKPLQVKLAYQVEKLVRKAESTQPITEDTVINGALSLSLFLR